MRASLSSSLGGWTSPRRTGDREIDSRAYYVSGSRRGGRSSAGRAPGCGPGGRGFESPRSPFAPMDDQLAAFLDALHRRGREHDAGKADRLERLRNLEPETARLLAVLCRTIRPKRILELGTSNGYSTVWLADAARATGAQLVSVELDPDRSAQARENLQDAGLQAHVELRIEDAGETLAGSPDAHWGLIFLDAERPAYAGSWADLMRPLEPAGLLVVDNVISHAEQVAEFRELVSADPRALDALAPTGAGALLIVKEATGGD